MGLSEMSYEEKRPFLKPEKSTPNTPTMSARTLAPSEDEYTHILKSLEYPLIDKSWGEAQTWDYQPFFYLKDVPSWTKLLKDKGLTTAMTSQYPHCYAVSRSVVERDESYLAQSTQGFDSATLNFAIEKGIASQTPRTECFRDRDFRINIVNKAIEINDDLVSRAIERAKRTKASAKRASWTAIHKLALECLREAKEA